VQVFGSWVYSDESVKLQRKAVGFHDWRQYAFEDDGSFINLGKPRSNVRWRYLIDTEEQRTDFVALPVGKTSLIA